MLISACSDISDNIKQGSLVIIESTIYPGVMEEIIVPIFKNKKSLLAHCPERIDPNNEKWTIENIPRVLGGINKKSTTEAKKFYESILDANIVVLKNIKSVEACKMVENSYRDINIAFINEMAKSFDKMGIDILEVINAAKTKPFGFQTFYPGPGVGGHCIPVDPYYLIHKGKKEGFNYEFLLLARKINDAMPAYVIELTENCLKKIGKKIDRAKLSILGISYKKNIDDIRESPSLKIIKKLKEKNVSTKIYDPHITNYSNVKNLDKALESTDCLVLLTDHDEFKNIEDKIIKNNIKVVIDTRNFLNKEKLKSAGIIYHGIGRS